MRHPFIVANWKSNKTTSEIERWFELVVSAMPTPHAEVILCPSFPLLPMSQMLIEKYHLTWKLGAQDVSSFTEGKHTGEVNAKQLKNFVDYVLIGHSERRRELKETDEMLFEKVKRVQEVGLTPIFFVQDKDTPIPDTIKIVAYEPIFAIGTGNPDTPEHAESIAKYLKKSKNIQTVLYGGSVDHKNVSLFLSEGLIDGVVPGTASLDPKEFVQLTNNA